MGFLIKKGKKPTTPWYVLWALLPFLLWKTCVATPTVTINFKDADLDTVIGWVAEQTGKNFVVDPRVKSKVTIVSGKPLSKDEVYQVFLSVLQVHGFAAVPSGNVIKIIPDVNAKQSGVPVTGEEDSGLHGDEMMTRVITLDNVPAAQLVPILRPLVPQQGHMVAYPPSNALIISDRAANIDRLLEIIQRVDIPSVESEIEIIPLQYASATEVVRIINALEQQNQQKQGGAEAIEARPTVMADERTNSVLLGGGKSNRLRLRTIISHLDIPLEREGNIHVIYLRYANAKDLVPVLTGIGQSVAQGETAKGGTGGAGGNSATLAPGQAFTIQSDDSTNALVITAPLEVYRPLQAVIRQLDVRRAQVLVEAFIAEVSLSFSSTLGVQWVVGQTKNGSTGPLGLTNFGNGTGNSLGDIATGIINKDITVPEGLTFALGRYNQTGVSFAALISALVSNVSTNVLATPTLLTLDNQEAEIVVGQNVPFLTGSYTTPSNGSGAGVTPFQTIQRQDVGITLKIKPQINEGNTLTLDIEQKDDSIAPSVAGAADLITNTRSIHTTVLVDDGEVVVLGGLINNNLNVTDEKVPGLGDLPLIGHLFHYKSTTKDKDDLMIFLHPVIVRDQNLMAQYSNSKYNFIRARQMEQYNKGNDEMSVNKPLVLPPMDDLLDLPPPFSELPSSPNAPN